MSSCSTRRHVSLLNKKTQTDRLHKNHSIFQVREDEDGREDGKLAVKKTKTEKLQLQSSRRAMTVYTEIYGNIYGNIRKYTEICTELYTEIYGNIYGNIRKNRDVPLRTDLRTI